MATEMKIRRMSDVQLQEVAWLWKAYIPFGKITIIQGDLGDAIKPRLIESGADESRILNIVQDNKSLSLLDERIEKAIMQTGTKLMILDALQPQTA